MDANVYAVDGQEHREGCVVFTNTWLSGFSLGGLKKAAQEYADRFQTKVGLRLVEQRKTHTFTPSGEKF